MSDTALSLLPVGISVPTAAWVALTALLALVVIVAGGVVVARVIAAVTARRQARLAAAPIVIRNAQEMSP